MKYIYETIEKNYEDYASGRVLYNAQGTTAFPVRLASEIIQRCFAVLNEKGHGGPYTIYDPCCGGAYWLTVITLLHGPKIHRIYASDIDPRFVQFAEKNLSLLTTAGMDQRVEEIKRLFDQYQKPSHREALESIKRLSNQLKSSTLAETKCFQRDITALDGMERPRNVNIVISDLPYGDIVSWSSEGSNPLNRFFENIAESLDPQYSVVAVVADKSQKLKHELYKRVQYFKIGKRQVGIFEYKG